MGEVNYQFSCRVFAGKVISVDCAGFPSELFAAKIIDGRIKLHGIARKHCREYILNLNKSRFENASAKEVSAEQHTPLANSTPARTQRLLKENCEPERRFSTPDIVRRVVAHQRSSPISSPSAHPRLKVVPLHRNPTVNTPTKLAKVSSFTRTNGNIRKLVTQVQVLRNLSNLSNFKIPLSPYNVNNSAASNSCNRKLDINSALASPTSFEPLLPLTTNSTDASTSRNDSLVLSSTLPSTSFQTSQVSQTNNETITSRSPNRTLITQLISSPLTAPSKWRKCLTPQRTYTRRDVTNRTQNQSNNSTTNPAESNTIFKVIPSYLINQTKCPAGEVKVIFQRRKLIVDKKLLISPKTFKKQLQYTKDLECVDHHLPKTRKQYIHSHQLAFDLLTNSSYYPRCAKALNLRFRRGCVNKKTDTISKYKQLIISIPELEK